jgi:hypothetical protein
VACAGATPRRTSMRWSSVACMCSHRPASSGARAGGTDATLVDPGRQPRHQARHGGGSGATRTGSREQPRGVSSSSAEPTTPWPAVTGHRRCGQSSQGTAEPRLGQDGLGRPTCGSARACGVAAWPHQARQRGDCARTGKTIEDVRCMDFKALTTTKPLHLNLNRLY